MKGQPDKYLHDTFVHNTQAAEQILPVLLEILKPQRVIDVGCGTGTWLKVLQDLRVPVIKGIEGPHLNLNKLLVPKEFVRLQDLEQAFEVKERFDLCISLEVAEHLSPHSSIQFIKQLTALSDVIYFSAAIPFQGGQNHINEQWFSYWIKIFKERNYVPHDIIRPMFWDHPKVEFWYAQNSCLFIKEGKNIAGLDQLPTFNNIDLVHPDLLKKLGSYRQDMWNGNVKFNTIAGLLAKKIKRSFKRK